MSKKIAVIDELNIKSGGLYSVMPFERLDKHSKAVFKVGFAHFFRHRLENYHTYFPQGVYMVSFLENPPIPRFLRSKNKETPTTQWYIQIEKFILDYIVNHGGKLVYSTTRIKNPNELKEGATEWVYTSPNIIHQAFIEAHKIYYGKLNLFHLDEINDIARANEATKSHYTGKIVFQL